MYENQQLHISLNSAMLESLELTPETGRQASHPSNQLFKKKLNELWELRIRKGLDYGADADPFANVRAIEEFGLTDWHGAAFRMNDKMIRIKNYIRRGELYNDDVDDDLRDIAVYAVIALVMREEANLLDGDGASGRNGR